MIVTRKMIQQSNMIDNLDSIASDLIEVSKVIDRDELRLQLMNKRIKELVNASNLVTQSEIRQFTDEFRRKDISYAQLCKLGKKLGKSLNSHYRTLANILQNWS